MGGLFYCRNFFQFLGEPQFCIVIIATALRPWTRKLFNKAAKHSFIHSELHQLCWRLSHNSGYSFARHYNG